MTTSIVIIGGGSAGWLTANILHRHLNAPNRPLVDITVIESASIGRIGVGEATIPTLKRTLAELGIDEYEFMRRTNATFKQAIRFTNWQRTNDPQQPHVYYHPFESFSVTQRNSPAGYYGPLERMLYSEQGDVTNYWWHRAQDGRARAYAYESGIQAYLCDARRSPKRADAASFESEAPYAYHFNAELFGDYLVEIGIGRGIRRIVDDVVSADITDDGTIVSVATRTHGAVAGAFFVDCTGFASLLIEKTLNVPYVEYGQHLMCDRAVALPVPLDGAAPRPYTSSIASDAGWIWEIDLSTRQGTGYVYSSQFVDDDTAEETLRRHIGPRAEGLSSRRLRMRVGRRAEFWRKNCVAIGLSAGFVEPLESTGIYLIEMGAHYLAEFFPFHGEQPRAIERYNAIMASQFDEVRDFIVLHYCLSKRDDTPFWREVSRQPRIPESLASKLDLWSRYLPNKLHLRDSLQIFDHRNYECILFGMGWKPKVSGGSVGLFQPPDGDRVYRLVRSIAQRAVSELPAHEDVLRAIHQLAPRALEASPVVRKARSVLDGLETGVVLTGLAVDPAKIHLSNGTASAVGAESESSLFKADALIPGSVWRRPTHSEFNALTNPNRLNAIGSYVSVIRLPEELREQTLALGAASLGEALDGGRPMFDGARERSIERLTGKIGEMFSEPNAVFRHLGITVNKPGMPTTTDDPSDDKLLGLHVDGWSHLGVEHRNDACNRMCINIGQESRRLFFINLPLRRIDEILSEIDIYPVGASASEIGRIFMQNFPDYPVVSLEIAPGEGYIAPTENVVHDGSTSLMTKPDVTMTWLGRFLPHTDQAVQRKPPVGVKRASPIEPPNHAAGLGLAGRLGIVPTPPASGPRR